MEEELSKKELLRLTGISYGQLYRWKREKLIPEEWFHKRSSVTGQETYFPKDAILNRVARILELKDLYSLEELAELFSPELVDRMFQEDDLERITEISTDVAAKCMDVAEKDMFSFREILLMCVLSQASETLTWRTEQQDAILSQMMQRREEIATLQHTVAILYSFDMYMLCIYATEHPPFLDERLKIVFQVDLQELSNQLKVKYHDTFHFQKEG